LPVFLTGLNVTRCLDDLVQAVAAVNDGTVLTGLDELPEELDILSGELRRDREHHPRSLPRPADRIAGPPDANMRPRIT
jgi:hypothetical protein